MNKALGLDDFKPPSRVGDSLMSFENLFRSCYAGLCYYVFRINDNKEEAEDIVQDAFFKLWNRWDDFNDQGSAKNFLYTTVRNASLNVVRHGSVKKKFFDQQHKDTADEPNILQEIIRAEVIGEIYRAIEQLPAGCRTIFTMGYIDGLKNAEIAGQLGISINTVKTQKARALQLLRLAIYNNAGVFMALWFIALLP